MKNKKKVSALEYCISMTIILVLGVHGYFFMENGFQSTLEIYKLIITSELSYQDMIASGIFFIIVTGGTSFYMYLILISKKRIKQYIKQL